MISISQQASTNVLSPSHESQHFLSHVKSINNVFPMYKDCSK